MDFQTAIAGLLQVFLFASFLALILERITGLFIKPVLIRYGREFWTPYAAVALGVLIAVLFGVDLIEPLALSLGLAVALPVAGEILTGILLGGGSNLLHDIWPGGARQ